MRLYLDENLASGELIDRLERAGHIVVRPLRGEPDERCWHEAQDHGAAVITMNAVDFVPFAEATRGHAGLLLIYRSNDRKRDMTMAAIADAIGRVVETHPSGVAGQILVLNQFQW